MLAIERGDIRAGLSLLGADFALSGAAKLGVRPPIYLGHVANGLSRIGQFAEGLGAIDEALAWCEQTGTRWPIPDFLRIKAEILLLQDAPGAAAVAEDHLGQPLSRARRRGARSLELRATTSLARLLRDQSRSADAKSGALLDAVNTAPGRDAQAAAAGQEPA